MRYFAAVFVMCALTGTVRGQKTGGPDIIKTDSNPVLRISGEFRPRTEYSHGYSTLAALEQKPSFFTSQRTRLNLDFKARGIQTRLVLQDVRLWGSQAQITVNEDFAVSVHEAWAEAQLASYLALRLGRQELNYDNGRLLGNTAWMQQGRSHDLALLRFNGFVEAHLGVAWHESGNRKNNFYLGPDAYKFMQFIWISKNFGKLKVSLTGINNGIPKNTLNEKGEITAQKTYFTQTVGPWFEFKTGVLSFNGNAYYQTGKLINGKDLSAYEYMLEAMWNAAKDLTLGAGYEELSGTNAEDATLKANSFNPMYGTGHKFNGHMDYFYVGNHIGSVGLRDLYCRIGYKIKGITLGTDLHKFWAAAALPGNPESSLGTELDFYGGYKINEFIEFNAGYSHLLPGPTMQVLKGGSTEATQNWAWVMFTFKPIFLK